MPFYVNKLFFNYEIGLSLPSLNAGVVKLVDTLDLGSSAERCVGSTPSIRTKLTLQGKLFYFKGYALFE